MIKQHYEKVIVGCCFAFIFANIGMASTAFSLHQPYLVAMEGIGDTGGSLILSVRTLVSFFAMLVVDRYYELLDVRRGVVLSCLMTAIGFLIYSVATSLPVFFLGAVALGTGYGFGGMVAMTILANRWFKSGVGGAIGFATMGSGFTSIILPVTLVQVIEATSLSVAFLIEAAIALVVGAAMALLLRNRPSDMGLQPYEGKPGKRNARQRQKLRPSTAMDRRLFLLAVVFVGAYCCGGMTYVTVLMTSSGFDAVFAASVVSIVGLALTVAKYVAGELFDRLGSPRASATMFTCGAIGFALCCLAGSGVAALMVVAGVLMGMGLSLGTVGVSVWSLDTAPVVNTTHHVRNFQVAYALGGFIANTLPGIVKDLVGNYVVSYAAMLVMLVLAAIIILRHYRKFAA